MEKSIVKKVIKRDAREVPFNRDNVFNAIWKAVISVGGSDEAEANQLTDSVIRLLNERYGEDKSPTVEEIQDIIEYVLIKEGHTKTAKAFILYRHKRKEFREFQHTILGQSTKTNLSLNALKILKENILLKDETGTLLENPEGMFRRVAKNIAAIDKKYDENADTKVLADEFYELISSLDFLPGSVLLTNAGTKAQHLAPSFVLPIEDSLDSIYDALRLAAKFQSGGSGTGFNFSKLRPKNDWMSTTRGYSTGPVSFIHVFDASTETLKQGGRRRGANMGILSVHHPDIQEFVTVKDKTRTLKNFNLSVALTEQFMEEITRDRRYTLINPKTEQPVRQLKATAMLDLISFYAWKSGDPGVLFIDRIKKSNPVPDQTLEATDSCAALLLCPYETCMIGSVNLANFVEEKKVNYDRLGVVVRKAAHLLDNAIDASTYPSKRSQEVTQENRKIGIGVMGYADMLYQMEIPYNSDEAVDLAKKLMKFIREQAKETSMLLAKKRGAFPSFKKSIYAEKGDKLRNATLTAIPPTGTISVLADVSASIEPNFCIAYTRKVLEGKEFTYINKYFAKYAKDNSFHSDALTQEIINKPSISEFESIPRNARKIFVTAHDIDPSWHLKVQGAFQENVDHAISKTINFPHTATIKDIKDVYAEAYKIGCKGVTVYRDGSLEGQVINFS